MKTKVTDEHIIESSENIDLNGNKVETLFVQILLAQNVSIITTTPAVLPITVEPSSAPEVTPFVPTFPLPPGGQLK